MVDYEFDFGENKKIKIQVFESSKPILDGLFEAYKSMYFFFTNTNNEKEKLENGYNIVRTALLDTSLNFAYLSNYVQTAEDVKELIYNVYTKANVIDILSDKKNHVDTDALCLVFYFILYFSFFEYDENSQDIKNCLTLNQNPDIAIEKSEGSYYYTINPDSCFVKFLNEFNNGWYDNYSRLCYNDTELEKTGDLLYSGKYDYNGKKYLFLKESGNPQERYPTNIRKFIQDTIYYETVHPIVRDVKVVFGKKSLYYCFVDGLLEIFKNLIINTEASYNHLESLTANFYNTEITFRGTQTGYIDYYASLFNYGRNILEKYVDSFKGDVDSLRTDDTLFKLINSLVSVSYEDSKSANNIDLKFNSDNDTLKIYDSDNDGRAIISCLISQVQTPIESTELNNNYYITNREINNISKLEGQSLLQGKMYFASNFYNDNIVDVLNKDKFHRPFHFYEPAIFNDITSVPEDQTKLKEEIDKFTKISDSIIFKIATLSFYYIEGNENYSIKTGNGNIKYVSSPEYWLKSTFTNAEDQTVAINGVAQPDFKTFYKTIGEIALKEIQSVVKIKQDDLEAGAKIEGATLEEKSFSEYIKSRLSGNFFSEKDFFYIGTGNDKRLPNTPFVDVEFKVLEYDSDGKNPRETWLPVSSIRKYKETEKDINGRVTKNIASDVIDEIFINKDNGYELHAGTYFDSMDLTDTGGAKQIELVLKSSNDINLENIIFSSLSSTNKTKALLYSGSVSETKISGSVFDQLNKIVGDSEANFRIRFGYRDVAKKDDSNNDTVINTSNNDDRDFLNRTMIDNNNKIKPVEVYPWTYFKITGLSSEIKSGEDVYTISGVSTGSYILNNLSVLGIPKNFSDNSDNPNSSYYGRPRNVIGKLARWIMEASSQMVQDTPDLTTARICFLGDEPGTILSGVDDSTDEYRFLSNEYGYELESSTDLSDENYFRGGNIESIENEFFNSANSNRDILKAKNFNLKSDARSLSIKEILDNLTAWLPSRIYYIGKKEDEQTVAIYLPYNDIYKINGFFENYPFKSERMKYQIIEANARIFKKSNSVFSQLAPTFLNKLKNNAPTAPLAPDFHKVYFIRMYYEGPGLSAGKDGKINTNEYLRVYNYRSLEQQVIQDISISSPDNSEMGQTISSITLLGGGQALVYSFNKEENKMSEDCISATNSNISSKITIDKDKTWANVMGDSTGNIKPYLAFNNSSYLFLNSTMSNTGGDSDSKDAIESTFKEQASLFFTDLQNKQYSGEMTILGDPFYYFDSSVEPAKYEIYLQMNRVKDPKTYELIRSRYTGIYYITNIKHSIDKEGKFLTTLSIIKRVFGKEDDDSSNNSNNSDK